ncbi:MAG: hypothetical protein KDI07_17835 [Anaerolineae bacterium]|nr:hypothetical protein [Anaerolineales bacterium]MCB0250440.1 hypothetical protein [Anaerolineae bacterium]
MLPDYEGSIMLIAAVVRLWIKDAGDNPAELAAVAGWLGMKPADLKRRWNLTPEAPIIEAALPGDMICPVCGGAVAWSGRGRFKVYCSDRCMRRAGRQRMRKNHAAE